MQIVLFMLTTSSMIASCNTDLQMMLNTCRCIFLLLFRVSFSTPRLDESLRADKMCALQLFSMAGQCGMHSCEGIAQRIPAGISLNQDLVRVGGKTQAVCTTQTLYSCRHGLDQLVYISLKSKPAKGV